MTFSGEEAKKSQRIKDFPLPPWLFGKLGFVEVAVYSSSIPGSRVVVVRLLVYVYLLAPLEESEFSAVCAYLLGSGCMLSTLLCLKSAVNHW